MPKPVTIGTKLKQLRHDLEYHEIMLRLDERMVMAAKKKIAEIKVKIEELEKCQNPLLRL